MLQHWIKYQFDDFDSQVIEQLEKFIKEKISLEFSSMAQKLSSEIEKKIAEQKSFKNNKRYIESWIQLNVNNLLFKRVFLPI